MKTIEDHFDDLDRLVEGGAAVATVRGQIFFTAREVAAELEARAERSAERDEDYARLAEAHAKLREQYDALLATQECAKRAGFEKLRQQSNQHWRSGQLDHTV